MKDNSKGFREELRSKILEKDRAEKALRDCEKMISDLTIRSDELQNSIPAINDEIQDCNNDIYFLLSKEGFQFWLEENKARKKKGKV